MEAINMGVLQINSNIFPLVMSISVGEPNSKDFNKIDLPRGANLLYLQSLGSDLEKRLLRKYANNERFSDEDYENLFKLFITNVPRLTATSGNVANFLEQFGVSITKKEEEGFKFNLIEDYIPQIKVDTWDYIAVDLLRPAYTDIINCFDFGEINIYLGAWKSDFDVQKQSLLNAFRSALMFTLVGYLYGDDKDLYASFNDYFDSEFYKRIALINGIWKHREEGKPISYIPIFDSFYNLNGIAPNELIKILRVILNDDTIVQDERNMIRNRLIDGATEIHSDSSSQRISLEQSVIKPVVNFISELESAKDNLIAAQKLHNENLFDAVINRCYYSMMHATKALLENKQQLSDWDADKLNVSENHRALTQKLKALSDNGIIANAYFADFEYVKQKRWIADYHVCNFNSVESNECIRRATSFLEEIKRLTA